MKFSQMFVCVLAVWVLAFSGCGSAPHPATSGGQSQTTASQTPAPSPQPVAQPAPQPVRQPAPQPMHVERFLCSNVPGLTAVQLDNGMRVIIKETHSAPIVDVRCYVQTGGMYEGRWLGAGLSHLCEHLTAEGAERTILPDSMKPRQTSRTDRIGRIGGQSNAQTRLDTTNYYIEAASGRTMECIDLVAEWMARPSITPADFEREHGIVQRELELGLNRPERPFYEAMMANMYPNHPAGVPVIGYRKPLAALAMQDVLEYHAQTYVPQNMVFLVVGDVDTPVVLERICKDMAGFRSDREPSHALPPVPPVMGTRRVVVPDPRVTDDTECLAFQTIPLLHHDLYALDLLSTIVGEGQASMLEQIVHREKNLVTSIGSGSNTPNWGTGYFEIYFHCDPTQVDNAEKATLAVLKNVLEKGVSPDDLARAKRQKVAEFVNSQQDAGVSGRDSRQRPHGHRRRQLLAELHEENPVRDRRAGPGRRQKVFPLRRHGDHAAGPAAGPARHRTRSDPPADRE